MLWTPASDFFLLEASRAREKRGHEGGGGGGFYRPGLEYHLLEKLNGEQSPAGVIESESERGDCGRKERVLTSGAHVSAMKKRARRTPSGVTRDGPWADFEAGPNRSPRPFILFQFLFGFLFPVYCVYFYLLQKCFNSNHFQKFSKINAMI
jgi:hypothetical protein